MSKFRGHTAIVGIGQTPYYKRGTSPDPELKLALRAIVTACEDAAIDPRDIDGFVSYASERSDAPKLMSALGTRQVRLAALSWFHGGGIPGALNLAASAIIAGQAEVVAVYRSLAERMG
jgi:acetyl-CoA acetyltransferase